MGRKLPTTVKPRAYGHRACALPFLFTCLQPANKNDIDNQTRFRYQDDYYPSSNLPSRLQVRGRPSDIERDRFICALVAEQVERSLEENDRDEWARPTLLGAALDAGDVDKAEELADRIEDEDLIRWKLEYTLSDLRDR